MYWGSTEGNVSAAVFQRFSDGFRGGASKNNNYLVRCVRP